MHLTDDYPNLAAPRHIFMGWRAVHDHTSRPLIGSIALYDDAIQMHRHVDAFPESALRQPYANNQALQFAVALGKMDYA